MNVEQLEPKTDHPTPAQIAQFERWVLASRDPAIIAARERERDEALDADYARFAATMQPEDWWLREETVRLLRKHQSQKAVAEALNVSPRTIFERMTRYEIGDTEWVDLNLPGHPARKPSNYLHSPRRL